MLNIIQTYMHGYVAVPLALACRRRGVFAAIDAAPQTLRLEDLAARWGANLGHLAAAFEVFETLEWVKIDASGRFTMGPRAAIIARIPEELGELISTPADGCVVSTRSFKPLKRLLLRSVENWGEVDGPWARYLDGCLVVPLVVGGCGDHVPATFGAFLAECSTDERRRTFRRWFAAKGWVDVSGARAEFSELGKFIFDRRLIMASVYSYRPMISSVDALLFGEAATIFGTRPDGRERHVERGLNVVASGHQHERYFQDLDQVLVDLFDHEDLARQPRYVADMGCGDGTLLRRIYQTVTERTRRGRQLESHPLVLVGIDFNAAALDECRKTLKGLPHVLLAGDIGDPNGLVKDLAALGVDPEQVLHIRSFLDHDRHLRETTPGDEGLAQLAKATASIHVARDGTRIAPLVSLHDLVSHLERWSKVTNRHGLLLFEVHCLSPHIKGAHLEEVESLHFDAYHSFSGQMLVEADIFLLAAARVGLFPKFEHCRRYPKLLDFTRLTFHHFVRHDCVVRHARPADDAALAELGAPPVLRDIRASEGAAGSGRDGAIPIERFVRERNGGIDGAFGLGRIAGGRIVALPGAHVESAPLGAMEYWCVILHDAPAADRSEQELLLRFALHLASLRPGGREVLVAVACAERRQAGSLSLPAYLAGAARDSFSAEPQLGWYAQLGGELYGSVASEADVLAGALCDCAIFRFNPKAHGGDAKRPARAEGLRPGPTGRASALAQIKQFLQETVNRLLDARPNTSLNGETALADLGLDSMDLIELRSAVASFANFELTTTFFFSYPTLNQIANALVAAAPVPLLSGSAHAAAAEVAPPGLTVPDSKVPEPAGPAVRAEDVAIVGVACRFPGDVDAPDALWQLLLSKTDPIGPLPADRATRDDFVRAADSGGFPSILTGGFLRRIEDFDNELFNLSPRESEWMDPQQRMLLQLVWEALESAGVNADGLRGSDTSVFAAAFTSDYERLQGRDADGQSSPYYGTGSCTSMLAGRISYLFGFQGPAISLNTACSSSLVALHYACRSLVEGESSLALACATNLIIQPDYSLSFAGAGMLSTTGRCKPFDASADGFVRSEGAGVLLLKRAQDAVRDGDHIWAVIKGSAINQDGASNGLTAPNGKAQESLLREALSRAALAPADIALLESHGTGTPLGDPIEWAAIHAVYGGREEPLVIGSVKSNIGHCEAAAGMAGVMKAVLALHHRQAPPNLHFTQSNPQIALDATPAVVPTETYPLRARAGQPLRAAVSAFGFSGTNAHLILEEFRHDPAPLAASAGRRHLMVFSAKSPERLTALLGRYRTFLESNACDLAACTRDLAYTLQTGRRAMEERVCFLVSSVQELLEGLRAYLAGGKGSVAVYQGNSKRDLVRIQLFEEELNSGQVVSRWINQGSLEKIAGYWVAGGNVEWGLFYSEEKPRRRVLPTYPFAARPFWVQRSAGDEKGPSGADIHPLLQRNVSTLREQAYESRLTSKMSVFRDHNVRGEGILPAVCYLEMARAAAARELPGQTGIEISDVIWSRPLLAGTAGVRVTLVLQPGANGSTRWEVFSTEAGQKETGRLLCAKGAVMPAFAPGTAADSLESIRSRCPVHSEPAAFYALCHSAGFAYGNHFQTVKGLWCGTNEILAEIQEPNLESRSASWGWLPGVLDGALQPILMLREGGAKSSGVPFAVERLKLTNVLPARFFSHIVRRTPAGATVEKYDISLLTPSGDWLGHFSGFSVAASSLAPAAHRTAQPLADEKSTGAADLIPKRLLRPRTEAFLKGVVSNACGTAVDAIQADQPFNDYGIDSIAVMTMTEDLEAVVGPLPKTLLFECKTLGELTEYFLAHHAGKLSDTFRPRDPSPVDPGNGRNGDPVPVASPGAPEPRLPAARARFIDAGHAQARGDIAIIGVAGRYPQAADLEEFWENLKKGRDCVTDVPPDRWSRTVNSARRKRGNNGSLGDRGGFMADVDKFDSLFFNIAPSEAELLDPQQRLFLETAWATLEDAGYTRSAFGGAEGSRLGRNVGVYVGVMYREYAYLGLQAASAGNARTIPWTDPSSIANRVSYFCDFHGPSMAVDTMCSSSLSCIHLACESLRNGSCDAALAGGVNLSVHPYKYDHLEQLGFLSPTGRCASFGAGGEGYIPGEGVGCVLLKPLAAAERDGDHIYGVIRATALNHGGRANGYTVPNPNAQADLIRQALAHAELDPGLITFVEAHGTGTALGDPIEFKALQQAYGSRSGSAQRCALGSVKSNIGHCEAAAGIAGLTKILLQMKHRLLVPSLHAEVLNPNIPVEQSQFIIQRDLAPWHRPKVHGEEGARIAAVSAFGAGGSNAHVIVQEYEPGEPRAHRRSSSRALDGLIVLSAMDDAQLREYARRLLRRVEKKEAALENIAYTLQTGREAHKSRLAIIAADHVELERKLSDWLDGRSSARGIFHGNDAPNMRSISFPSAGEPVDADEVGQWMGAGDIERVAAYWVRGGALDWSRLHQGDTLTKVSLPTYPFARIRHWLNVGAVHTDGPTPPADNGSSRSAKAGVETAGPDRAQVAVWLRASLARQLKIAEEILTADSPLRDFGVDSILLLEWVEGLEAMIQTKLDPVVMLGYPTLAKLADYLSENHGEALARAAIGTDPIKPGDMATAPNGYSSVTARAASVSVAATRDDRIISSDEQERKIAIVGMACHFPGAANLDQYWLNLRSGKDCVREVPPNRWDLERFFSAAPGQNRSISRWGGFLDDIRSFDPDYFGIEESLASHLDPLARQWLEVSAEALADAGYGKRDLWGEPVGVFAGSRVSNFHTKIEQYNRNSVFGLGQNSITALISHFYNFKGPSLVVDSACSGSLSSIHLAVASLLAGESRMALAGGVDILLDEYPYLVMSAAHMLSPDGRCKTMDESANGIVLGEGCGVLALKTLQQALADKNKIYGVIEGTALNSDGYSMGISTPDPKGQQAVIEKALRAANVPPASVSYVEMHGTGTLLGDAIELRALSRIFDQPGGGPAHCGVGSAKSNLGHLLSAGGVAGLIKTVLSIVHRELPPTLHCDRPNPRHNFEGPGLFPVRSLRRWEAPNGVLRAGVSAFGLGGSNAHVIVSNEGIPADRAATTKPLGSPVKFARRVLWPSEETGGKTPGGEDVANDGAFLEMFEMVPS